MKINQVKEYIKSDLYRYAGTISIKSLVKNYFFNRSFRYLFWFRLCKSKSFLIRIAAKMIHYRLTLKFGIQIPSTTQVGYGLYIAHGMSVVINPTTIIGNNCNLSQFTTIGSNKNQAAHIGNNVYIGPNVCIVENVVIGDNTTIGAGSVVTHDISDNYTVAGVPAKVISQKKPGRFINKKWPCLEEK